MGTSQERVFTVFQTYLTLSVDPFYQSLFFHHPEKKCFIYYLIKEHTSTTMNKINISSYLIITESNTRPGIDTFETTLGYVHSVLKSNLP